MFLEKKKFGANPEESQPTDTDVFPVVTHSAAHTGVPLGATVPEGMGFKDHISRAENMEK